MPTELSNLSCAKVVHNTTQLVIGIGQDEVLPSYVCPKNNNLNLEQVS
jgi:hypothetical protein